MRKVVLNMKEQDKYLTIKKVAEGKLSKHATTVRLSLTRRQINRLLASYQHKGKATFVHGSNPFCPLSEYKSSTSL